MEQDIYMILLRQWNKRVLTALKIFNGKTGQFVTELNIQAFSKAHWVTSDKHQIDFLSDWQKILIFIV